MQFRGNKAGDGFTYLTYPGPNDPKDLVWQDVVPIPAGVTLLNGQFIAGRVTIRQHFADFTGHLAERPGENDLAARIATEALPSG